MRGIAEASLCLKSLVYLSFAYQRLDPRGLRYPVGLEIVSVFSSRELATFDGVERFGCGKIFVVGGSNISNCSKVKVTPVSQCV